MQNCTYAILDFIFTASKFILTIRDSNEWFDSVTRFHLAEILKKSGISRLEEFNELTFKDKEIYLHKNYLYNNAKEDAATIIDNKPHYDWSLVYNREHRIKAYESRNLEIIKYFRDCNEQLLVIDITKEKDSAKIIRFLGHSEEQIGELPHLNRSL